MVSWEVLSLVYGGRGSLEHIRGRGFLSSNEGGDLKSSWSELGMVKVGG